MGRVGEKSLYQEGLEEETRRGREKHYGWQEGLAVGKPIRKGLGLFLLIKEFL